MIHIESDEELGEVRIMSDVATIAKTKSRIWARRIRDTLNAPNCIEGQTVRLGQGRDKIGVVQLVVYDPGWHFRFLVRCGNDLVCWSASDCTIVEPTYHANQAITDDPKPMYRVQMERDLYRKMLEQARNEFAEQGHPLGDSWALKIKTLLDRVDEGLLP